MDVLNEKVLFNQQASIGEVERAEKVFDAVFAASDMMALGALRAIQESGRRVPHDIALVGFDDMPATNDAALNHTGIAI